MPFFIPVYITDIFFTVNYLSISTCRLLVFLVCCVIALENNAFPNPISPCHLKLIAINTAVNPEMSRGGKLEVHFLTGKAGFLSSAGLLSI